MIDQTVTPTPMPIDDPQPAASEATLDELVSRARRLIEAGQRRILGVTGTPGAGKSTLCAALLDALGADAVLVGMDGFHFANAELARLGRSDRKGAFDTFDVDGYTALLGRLREQRSGLIYAPVFNRGIEESIGSAVGVPAEARLVITEGNYLLLDKGGWAGVRACLDEVWFLDVAPQVRTQRLMLRRQSFGHSVADSQAWVNAVDERNADVVDDTRGRADLVVHLRTSLGAGETLDPAPGSTTPTPANPEGASR